MTKLVDLRDPAAAAYSDDIRTFVVLGPTDTYLFHWERGNVVAWPDLVSELETQLHRSFQQDIDDIHYTQDEVVIEARCGGEQAATSICDELLRRNVILPSAPIVLLHEDGSDEYLGPAGEVARKQQLAFAA